MQGGKFLNKEHVSYRVIQALWGLYRVYVRFMKMPARDGWMI